MGTPAISPDVLSHFASLPDEQKRAALGRMGDDTKQALLTAIQARNKSQSRPAGLPDGMDLPGFPTAHPSVEMQEASTPTTTAKRIGNRVVGNVKSIADTLTGGNILPDVTPESAESTFDSFMNDLGSKGQIAEGAANSIVPGAQLGSAARGYVKTAKKEGVGNAAADVAGDVGTALLLGKGVPTMVKGVRKILPESTEAAAEVIPTDKAKETLGYLAQKGVRNSADLGQIGETSLPIFQQAARELNMVDDAGNVNLQKRATIGDIFKGKASSSVRNSARQAVPLAQKAVEIANRPFRAALSQVESQVIPASVKEGIVSQIEAEMNHFAPRDSRYATTLQAAMDDVRNAKTYGDLNNLREFANKKLGEKFETADAALPYSYKAQANAIREGMYPEISRMTGTDLTEFGRRARDVQQAAHGLEQYYQTVVDPEQAAQTAKGRFGAAAEGVGHHPRGMVAKTVRTLVGKQPAGEFAAHLNDILSNQGAGAVNEAVSVTPRAQLALPGSTAPYKFNLPTGIPQEFINGASSEGGATAILGTPDVTRYVGTETIPNPNFTPIEGPSYRAQRAQLGTTAETIPTSARGVMSDARARLDQAPIGTPNQSVTGPESLTRSVFETTPGIPDNVQYTPPPAGASGEVLRTGGGSMTTSDVEAAKRAFRGINRYVESKQFNSLPMQEQTRILGEMHQLGKQISDFVNAPQSLPQSVKVTPGKAGVSSRYARGKAFGAKVRALEQKKNVAGALLMLEGLHNSSGAQVPTPADTQ